MFWANQKKRCEQLKLISDTLRPLNSVARQSAALDYVRDVARRLNLKTHEHSTHINLCRESSFMGDFEFAVIFGKNSAAASEECSGQTPTTEVWVFGYDKFSGFIMKISQYYDLIETHPPVISEVIHLIEEYRKRYPGSSRYISHF